MSYNLTVEHGRRQAQMSSILEKARQILAVEGLCDHCLGRQFAKFSTGLSNKERGQAIRVLLSLEENKPLKAPDLCTICLGQFAKIEEWATKALTVVEGLEFSSYLFGTRFPSFMEEKEKRLWERFQIESGESIKHEFNREVGKCFGILLEGKGIKAEVDFKEPDILLLINILWDRVELKINSLFIYGRYRKLVRGIPQTRWPCRSCRGRGCPRCNFTGKMYPESVEELISPPIVAAACGNGSAFHGAGREDCDALMLGGGRPFVLEIKEPKVRKLNLEKLEAIINEQAAGKIEVSELKFTTKATIERIKDLEASKVYRAKIQFDQPLLEVELRRALQVLEGLIEQRTPQRVLHRRADKIRERRVLEAKGQMIKENEALIEIRCESGLYVKELISGDSGRTRPSLAELLGTGAKVIELNVLEVSGDEEIEIKP